MESSARNGCSFRRLHATDAPRQPAEHSKSYRADVRLTRHSAETADEIFGEQVRLLGECAGALGVACVERVLGAGQEALDDPEILLLLPAELFRIHLAQQR